MAEASKIVTEVRDAVGLTAKHLAKRMKISDTALRRYGYGDRNPRVDALQRLVQLLDEHGKYLQRLSRDLAKFLRERARDLGDRRKLRSQDRKPRRKPRR